jgi:hypothetical protein
MMYGMGDWQEELMGALPDRSWGELLARLGFFGTMTKEGATSDSISSGEPTWLTGASEAEGLEAPLGSDEGAAVGASMEGGESGKEIGEGDGVERTEDRGLVSDSDSESGVRADVAFDPPAVGDPIDGRYSGSLVGDAPSASLDVPDEAELVSPSEAGEAHEHSESQLRTCTS